MKSFISTAHRIAVHPRMVLCSVQRLVAFVVLIFVCIPLAYGWGIDGHLITCRLAQPRLNRAAAEAVSNLLPAYADNDLSSLCSWADHVKFRYHWSSALHYIDTPDNLCTYQYRRDCKDEDGMPDRCVAGAIYNYTSQLLSYGRSDSQYNLTEALLFLAHFIGDIHQPLHVGFTADRGGNTIDVHWYRRKAVLHHVWDDEIIETEEERFYDSSVDQLIETLQKNITTVWASQAKAWEACSKTACPDAYATEGIKAACDWAYKGVDEGSFLGDDYFVSRYPVVNMRLAQGGVRLAATLNQIFG
ncbi:endonuclease 2-like [Andrographis paniculata]|uniref:endonuclease 2-like n=1 Tax=Andrographis paniculata TaxID=175694 RepID=UPI0021E84E60|nr:endonuclease 2-like [Andrographis paniculata]